MAVCLLIKVRALFVYLAIEALIGNKICLHQGIFVSYRKRKEKVIRNSRFIIPLPFKTQNKLELEFGFRNQ